MFAFHMLHIVELGSPELTGEWEHKLKLIEAGKLTREEFMRGINDLVKNVVGVIKNGEIPDVAYATVPAPCPKCGGTVQENYRKVQCQKCDFTLWRVISGREWAPEELAELFTKRFVGPLTGFRSKQGRPFSAGIRLNDEMRLEFDFGQGAGGRRRSARLFRPGAARCVPEMRRARVRARRRLCVRKGGRPGTQVRLPLRAPDPATADRARADEEAAGDRAHRSPHQLRFQEEPQVQGLPRQAARRQDRLRISAAREGQGREAGRKAGPKDKAPDEKTTRPGSARRAR